MHFSYFYHTYNHILYKGDNDEDEVIFEVHNKPPAKPIIESKKHSLSNYNNQFIDYPAIEVGSIQCDERIPGIGGGRRIVATSNINKGDIIIVEKPVIYWRTRITLPIINIIDETGLNIDHLWTCLISVMAAKNVHEVLPSIEQVYPMSITDISFEKVTYFESIFSMSIIALLENTLVEYTDDVVEANMYSASFNSFKDLYPSKYPIQYFIRLLLAISTSSFNSGFYLHSSLFNHSCQPNSHRIFDGRVSTIEAIEDINKGEEITICYLDPVERELSIELRTELIQKQFEMICFCSKCKSESKSI